MYARIWMLAAVAVSGVAAADTVDITWTAPTAREDGTALVATEIAGYRLSWSVNGVAQPDKTLPASTSYRLDTGTAMAGWQRVCVTLRTVDTDGLESAPTDQVCRKARPAKPGNVRAK